MEINAAYDVDADALYVALYSAIDAVDSEEVAPGVIIDLDEDGHVLGFEVAKPHTLPRQRLSLLAERYGLGLLVEDIEEAIDEALASDLSRGLDIYAGDYD